MRVARALWGLAVVACACGTSDVYVGSDLQLAQPTPAGGGATEPPPPGDSMPPLLVPPPSSVDASQAASDAGGAPVVADAGAPVLDAGSPDAGAPVLDAGPADTGVVSVDAGLPDTGVPVLTCPDGFDDCDGDASNGCEHDVSADEANCGACGVVCPTDAPSSSGSSCVDGACVLTCNLITDDCDGDLDNGCEANLWVSSDNCGACGVQCTCHDGRCL